FLRWIQPPNQCIPGRIWAVGSSTPLFVTDSRKLRLNVARNIATIGTFGEVGDDLLDSWGHPRHEVEQLTVVNAIGRRLERCPTEHLIVLSGDIHQSALIGISINDVVVGYEIISS